MAGLLPPALLAGLLIACSPSALIAARPVSDAGRLAALARDVDRAESIRAVKRLETAWAHYIDTGEWQRAADLFADDAELIHAEDRFRGKTAIAAYFRRAIGKGIEGLPPNTIHTPFLVTPIVTLSADGNTAKGRWHAVAMRGALGGEASWEGGVFECVYVRQNGAWKIGGQVFKPTMTGPYETGWHSYYPELPVFPYHFQPDDVGTSAVLGPAVGAPATKATLSALAGRIRALRDEQAIRNLQDAYGYYVDQKMWVDVADLFAANGSIEISGVGRYAGKVGIRQALERDGPDGLRYGEMNDHVQADLIVDVMPDGKHARARGIDIGMIGRNEGSAYWVVTSFDNLFVKQDGIWRFDTMRQAVGMKTDYAQGWGKSWTGPGIAPPELQPAGPAPATLPPLWEIEHTEAARPQAGMSLAQAEKSVFVAAAYDAIENLAGGYGQYLDDNHWEELGQLFAAQGERDSAGGGFIRTPARIAAFSRQRYGPYNPHRIAQNMHMRTQPVIDLSPDGRKGQMRTRLLQFVIAPNGATGPFREPMIITGMYEDDVVFENGRWRIQRADIDHLLYTHSYKDGWTHIAEGEGAKRSPPLSSVAGVKFDAPGAGDTEPSFPKLPHMWFHYRNPVSGREPPYLMPKYPLPQP
ncbi:nuclear transport factor 2 family protein [Sphingomonas sp. MMS24-J13]|uniref:nuclear transport factor 2 family protein n=1 Tax=Sphingomonas sp. MMS24-J13 TaxID=3238686 RepID=UPI00384E0BF6